MPYSKTYNDRGNTSLTILEVAKILKMKKQTVHKAEQRALRKIRAAMESEAEKLGMTVQQWLCE